MGRKLKILSIDGGGIRGIIPAMFLEEIEKILSEPVHKYFDLVCGTSTGGIIALAIAFEKPMAEVKKLYEVKGPEIFPISYRKNVFEFIGTGCNMLVGSGGKYRASILEEELKRIFSVDNKYFQMREAKVGLCVPSVNVSSGQVVVFKTPHKVTNPKEEVFSNDANKEVWKVARATSAAPTYFRTAAIESSFFVDGGLYANNPSLVGIIEARRCEFDLSEMSILSLGTGSSIFKTSHKKAKNMNLFNWGFVKGILELSMESQSMSVENQISLLNPSQYERLQCTFKEKLELDHIEQLPDFKSAAEQLIKERRDDILSEFFNEKAQSHLYPLKGGSNGGL